MFRGLSVLAVLLVLAGSAPAVAQVPTEEQLQLLRTMSPEDRAALMEQLGLGNAVLGESATDTSPDGSTGNRTTRNSDLRSNADRQALAERLNVDKALKPDDSLLIDIDFRKDKPARIESPVVGQPPITIPGEPAPVLTEVEHTEAQRLIDLIRGRNPYQLDSSGALLLPGFAPIMLAGLNEEQATHRIASIIVFIKLDIKLTKLPVRQSGVAGLKPSATTCSRTAPRPSRPSPTYLFLPTTSSVQETS